MEGQARHTSLDLARGIAVVLAMLSHALVQFSAWDPFLPWLRLLTRLATPTFLILFGIMLQIVHLARWDRHGAAAVSGRLFQRGLTCYAIYALISLAALLTGKVQLGEALRAIVFLDDGRFGEILKIYAVLMVLAVPLLLLCRRFGVGVVLVLIVGCWSLNHLLRMIPFLAEHRVFAFWLGSTPGFGPAMLLAPTLVGFGLLLGRWIMRPDRWLAPALLLAASVAVLAGFLSAVPGRDLIGAIASQELRGNNHPAYYAYGMLGASALLAGAHATVHRAGDRSLPPVLLSAGRNSIFAYGFGNILLNLLPRYDGPQPWLGATLAASFLVALLLLNHAVTVSGATSRRAPLRLLRLLCEQWRRTSDRAAAPLAHWVAGRGLG